MKKKKIALILATFPKTGGGHQYAMLVAECLAENRKSNYDLLAMCCNPFWHKWCRDNHIECIDIQLPVLSKTEREWGNNFPFFAMLYHSYLTHVGRRIRKEKIDILFPLQSSYVPPYFRVKLMVPVHDLMHRYEGRFPEVRVDYENREVVMKSYARYADVILVDSRLGKKQFEESYCTRGGKRAWVVSLPFIAPEHIVYAKEEELDVPSKYVFYPAQFWKHKNHLNLVKAIQLLKNEIQDIHLVLVGSEKNNYREIRRYIYEHHLENNITILGFVKNENITFLYRHAVGLIMPTYFGPTNMPPLEAMALKCPVAVSNKYAMPEQVGKAGLMFNPDSPREIAECIRKLWLDGELCEKLKELGYQRSLQWNKNKFACRLLSVIDKL